MQDTYDAIIVGAGMGGLMCGNFLARAGRRVLMLEHNHQAGGLMAGFWRKGFYFDAGDQSIENMGIVFPLLKQLGLYRPEDWERARYRLLYPGMGHIITDFKGTAEAMAKAFPNQADGLRRLFIKIEAFSGFIKSATEKGRIPFTATGLEQIVGLMRLVGIGMRNLPLAWELISTKIDALARAYITDPEALKFFSMPGYQGMSTANGAGFWHMWVHDYWYPRRGIQSLIDDLAGSFRAHGGELRFKTMVAEIIVSGSRALGVRTAQGETLYAKHIVYCGDMIRLYTKMLPAGTASPAFIRKITAAPVAEPLVALYLGLDIDPEELRRLLKVHHTFSLPRNVDKGQPRVNAQDLHRDTWIEINAPCLENHELAPAGKSAVTVQAMTDYRWMDTWGTGGDEAARPDEYRRLKEKVKDDLLHSLERVIPGVRDKVSYWDLGTPLSTIRFTLNKEGGSCAFTFDPDLAPFSRQPAQFRTPVRGLYMAGQWSLWPGGVVGAALSGKIVASHILSGFYSDVTDGIYQLIRKTRRAA